METLNSAYKSLGINDFINAFWLFLSSTVVAIVGDAILQAYFNHDYSLSTIHWKEIGAAIVTAIIGYLKVLFFTNSKGEMLTKETK
jgi:hypothetical protein